MLPDRVNKCILAILSICCYLHQRRFAYKDYLVWSGFLAFLAFGWSLYLYPRRFISPVLQTYSFMLCVFNNATRNGRLMLTRNWSWTWLRFLPLTQITINRIPKIPNAHILIFLYLLLFSKAVLWEHCLFALNCMKYIGLHNL